MCVDTTITAADSRGNMSMMSVAPVDVALAAEDSLDGNEEDMDLVDSAPVWPRSGKSYRAYL